MGEFWESLPKRQLVLCIVTLGFISPVCFLFYFIVCMFFINQIINMWITWHGAARVVNRLWAAAVLLTECISLMCVMNKDDWHMSRCVALNSCGRPRRGSAMTDNLSGSWTEHTCVGGARSPVTSSWWQGGLWSCVCVLCVSWNRGLVTGAGLCGNQVWSSARRHV